MYSHAVFFASVLAARVVKADFLILTDGPLPTATALPNLPNTPAYESWYSSLEGFASSRVEDWQKSQSGYDAAHSKFVEFVATATYSIDREVTNTAITADTETFTTLPDWYKALPSDVRAAEEARNEFYIGLNKEIVSRINADPESPFDADTTSSGAPTSTGANSTSSSVAPTGSKKSDAPTSAGATPTPSPTSAAQGRVAGMGAGIMAAAAVAGALFL